MLTEQVNCIDCQDLAQVQIGTEEHAARNCYICYSENGPEPMGEERE